MVSWIKDCVFYQIYPTSFYDGNGDGVGDLKGITEKVDYVKSLGVGAIWLNPVYKSPFKDAGYDISDYYAINERFGTMDDLKSLIKVYHDNGIRVIMDIVFGHTSNKHEWFRKSANIKRNKYSDYYIWAGNDFGEYDSKFIKALYNRDGGYMMNYYACQPALNFGFTNPDPDKPWQMHYTDERLKPLREELINVMRFYLDMGVDGFRADMAGHMVKGYEWYDEEDDHQKGNAWFWNTVINQIRSEYKDVAFIAEWIYPPNSVGKCGFDVDFLAHDTPAFNELFRNEPYTNLVREIELGDNYFSLNGKGTAKNFVDYVEMIYKKIDGKGYLSTPTGSHDAIRVGNGKTPDLLKTVYAFLFTYKNVPFLYYGDEIGLEQNYKVRKDGGWVRTGARTPMQWNNGLSRGFSSKRTTYLPTNKKIDQSVESQLKDENSVLNVVKKLINLRKVYSCLNADGEQKFIETGYPCVFERKDGKNTVDVLINPSAKTVKRKVTYLKILLSQNCEFKDGSVKLNKASFALLLK